MAGSLATYQTRYEQATAGHPEAIFPREDPQSGVSVRSSSFPALSGYIFILKAQAVSPKHPCLGSAQDLQMKTSAFRPDLPLVESSSLILLVFFVFFLFAGDGGARWDLRFRPRGCRCYLSRFGLGAGCSLRAFVR